ncbi:MAG: hypothetical protein FJ399_23710 [Verrucomicrobia bacterium]|nr:hypothetical protein [Verrucomicrobiota bacterium]
MTFAEKFCRQRNVHPADFEQVVLRLTLRPAARFLRPLLGLNRDYFASDRELIRDVGRIKRVEDFAAEAEDFSYNPYNRGFLHRTLRLRISRRRLRDVVRQTFALDRAAKQDDR